MITPNRTSYLPSFPASSTFVAKPLVADAVAGSSRGGCLSVMDSSGSVKDWAAAAVGAGAAVDAGALIDAVEIPAV